MEPLRMTMLGLALVVLSLADAHSFGRGSHATLHANATNKALRKASSKGEAPRDAKATSVLAIEPKIKDVASDEKFFGPPFPADYPDDKRPAVQKSILDKLKGPDQPYPALQSKADFDRDYIKDENSDKGSWKAHMEYDTLRKKLAQEQADEKRAKQQADKEARDADAAQGRADAAAKNAADAKKGVDDAEASGHDGSGSGSDAGAEPSVDELDKLKKKVAQAEASYEKEKKDFAECQKQLEDAEAQLKDLKAKQASMEEELAGKTQFWKEHQTIRLNARKAKEASVAAKHKAADMRLEVAKKNKLLMDERLAAQKYEHELAQKSLRKEKAEMEEAREKLEKATLTLQRLQGHAPAEAKPLRSGAQMRSLVVFMPVVSTLVMSIL